MTLIFHTTTDPKESTDVTACQGQALILFNVSLFDWQGLKTFSYDRFSFFSAKSPQLLGLNVWFQQHLKHSFYSKAIKEVAAANDFKELCMGDAAPTHVETKGLLVDVILDRVTFVCPSCSETIPSGSSCDSCNVSPSELRRTTSVFAEFEDLQGVQFPQVKMFESILDFLGGVAGETAEKEMEEVFQVNKGKYCFQLYHLVLKTHPTWPSVYGATPIDDD